MNAGYHVRALARSAFDISVSHSHLEKISGNALDPGTVMQALSGVGAVIQTLGVAARPDVIFRPTRLFSDATRVLVNTMKATGVERLISVTGLGAGDSRYKGGLLFNTAFALLLGRIYADKDAQEWIIRESSLKWTICDRLSPRTDRERSLTAF